MTKVEKTVAPEKSLAELEKEFQDSIDAKKTELRKKYPDVWSLRTGDKVAYLKKPTRKDISMARTLAAGEEIAYYELLMDAVWIEGDKEIRDDDDYFFNAYPQLGHMIETKIVELKKN